MNRRGKRVPVWRLSYKAPCKATLKDSLNIDTLCRKITNKPLQTPTSSKYANSVENISTNALPFAHSPNHREGLICTQTGIDFCSWALSSVDVKTPSGHRIWLCPARNLSRQSRRAVEWGQSHDKCLLQSPFTPLEWEETGRVAAVKGSGDMTGWRRLCEAWETCSLLLLPGGVHHREPNAIQAMATPSQQFTALTRVQSPFTVACTSKHSRLHTCHRPQRQAVRPPISCLVAFPPRTMPMPQSPVLDQRHPASIVNCHWAYNVNKNYFCRYDS